MNKYVCKILAAKNKTVVFACLFVFVFKLRLTFWLHKVMIICLKPFNTASGLVLHPCIPHFLSPSRQCIPIPPSVAGSSGESCLPCATGRQNAAVAEPVRTEQKLRIGERKHVRTRGNPFVRPSDSGKCRSPFIMDVTGVLMCRLASCLACFSPKLFYPPYPFNCPQCMLR